MSQIPIMTVELRYEQDVVLARRRAREIAERVGLGAQDAIRVATAVSEMARNAFRYANGGRVAFALDRDDSSLAIEIADRGRGIAHLDAVLDGTYRSATGMGKGIVGTRRLMDRFAIASSPAGTVVRMGKALPTGVVVDGALAARVVDELARLTGDDPLQEMQRQNQELLRTLDELGRANRDLQDLNRGIAALHAELDERAREFQSAAELKTRFLSHMTHEFQTPINSIMSLVAILLKRFDGPLAAEQERQVRMIDQAARGLDALVADLLDLSKVAAGKVVIRPRSFAVADLFSTLKGIMHPLLPQGGDAVALVFVEPPASAVLVSDEAKVGQILRNLVSNALKFTERGAIRVEAVDAGDHVELSVTDTGLGIPAEEHGRIFQEFSQVEHSAQSRVRGTGLGLPLSRKLARILGGDISVVSAPGAGSRFTVHLPKIHTGATEGGLVETSSPINAPVILVIDDDDISRYLVRSALAVAGFAVREATGGRQGVELALQLRPSLVLLDLMMAEVSGFDVLAALRSDPATAAIPIIVRTSKVLDAGDRTALAGVLGVVAKAESRAEEWNALRAILRRSGFPLPPEVVP
jgi:signal transduction histidine kinase